MPARDALKAALRPEFVPLLRDAGFRGTFPTWRVSQNGNVAIVNIQSSSVADWGEFYVNLSVVPTSWWAWTHECAVGTPWGSNSRVGSAKEWDGLYRARLTRSAFGGATRWTFSGADGAGIVGAAMAARLPAALERLVGFLDPAHLLSALSSGQIDGDSPVGDRSGMKEIAVAVLLSEMGGPKLEQACELLDQFAGRDYSELPLTTAAWARARANARALDVP